MRFPFRHTDEQLRAMYPDGRGDLTARRYASFWAGVFGLGLFPRRWVTLEVVGRRSGELRRFPLGAAEYDGERYLVSMLGECNWVRNVRASEGRAVLRHGRAKRIMLVEVPVVERAPILKRYLQQVPGARPHIAVDRGADVNEFATVAASCPVFRIDAS